MNITIDYFGNGLKMEVSSSKSKITSSMPTIARLAESLVVKRKASSIQVRRGETAKMLGVGTNGGVSRVTAVLDKRVRALKKKLPRYRLLGSKGF